MQFPVLAPCWRTGCGGDAREGGKAGDWKGREMLEKESGLGPDWEINMDRWVGVM